MRHPHKPKKQNNFFTVMWLLTALLVAVAGCSEKRKTSGAPATPLKSGQSVTSQLTTTALTQETRDLYVYDPGERRDPFAPIVVRDNKVGRSGQSPLERYTIAEFRMTGILWGGFGYNAMLEGPDGKGYFVREGSVIGQNRGVVRKITQDSMIIEEIFKNYMGVDEKKEIIVNLRKKQEGM